MELEKQVLTWAIDEGPIYVVTGTTFRRFPHNRFQVYNDNILNPDAIYPNRTTMQEAVTQHRTNFTSTSSGDLLRPLRNANPANVGDRVRGMRMPTGYFKVIYRPAANGEPAYAIGFLLPHSFQNLNLAADSYSNLTTQQAFWLFVSRIDLIEETSGVRFPGIPNNVKSDWGDDWFFDHDNSRSDLRASSCGRGTPQGILPNSMSNQRVAACVDMLH